MRKTIILLAAMAMSLLGTAQDLPQFIYNDYDGWSYNNSNVELSPNNIANGKIYLYVNQAGVALTLSSPEFSCQGMDSISTQVNWYTPSFHDENFELSRTALTLALDDTRGNPIDSVTCTPTTSGTSSHVLKFSIAVPAGVDSIRMRLVSWQANVLSCGAVKRALFQAVTATPQVQPGDIDGDGSISVSDVTRLISQVLNGGDEDNLAVYDVDGDGSISVSDVTMLISIVLNGV